MKAQISYGATSAAIAGSKPFQRLADKAQVHHRHAGNDHVATRLSHSIGVAMASRNIAGRLGLDEFLAEAIGLAHDLGHGPFGHVGEATLNQVCQPWGFKHAVNSVRLLEELEANNPRIHFSEVLKNGVRHHSKGSGNFFTEGGSELVSAEGKIVRIVDALDYVRADYDDACRLGLVALNERPSDALDALGSDTGAWSEIFVDDVVNETLSLGSANPKASAAVISAVLSLRAWLFERLYLPLNATHQSQAASKVVAGLWEHFSHQPEDIPGWDGLLDPRLAARNWVSGMTDAFAIATADALCPGVADDVGALPIILPPTLQDVTDGAR